MVRAPHGRAQDARRLGGLPRPHRSALGESISRARASPRSIRPRGRFSPSQIRRGEESLSHRNGASTTPEGSRRVAGGKRSATPGERSTSPRAERKTPHRAAARRGRINPRSVSRTAQASSRETRPSGQRFPRIAKNSGVRSCIFILRPIAKPRVDRRGHRAKCSVEHQSQ
jgi:hypothetical protein